MCSDYHGFLWNHKLLSNLKLKTTTHLCPLYHVILYPHVKPSGSVGGLHNIESVKRVQHELFSVCCFKRKPVKSCDFFQVEAIKWNCLGKIPQKCSLQ